MLERGPGSEPDGEAESSAHQDPSVTGRTEGFGGGLEIGPDDAFPVTGIPQLPSPIRVIALIELDPPETFRSVLGVQVVVDGLDHQQRAGIGSPANAVIDAAPQVVDGKGAPPLLHPLSNERDRRVDRIPARPQASSPHQGVCSLEDLAAPIDVDVDHVRGPADAPVSLVEYADFECPHCGRAEPAVRELLRTFESDVRFVFRHLPLGDVHEHAQLAAEASESEAEQGRFWEMHDALYGHQDALDVDDLVGYARDLGLDVERFSEELMSGRHTLRVARDVESADVSGVVGTPTFFVNGRRHYGAYDEATLLNLVRESLATIARPRSA